MGRGGKKENKPSWMLDKGTKNDLKDEPRHTNALQIDKKRQRENWPQRPFMWTTKKTEADLVDYGWS